MKTLNVAVVVVAVLFVVGCGPSEPTCAECLEQQEQGLPAEDGCWPYCEPPDQDGDGIADDADACPAEPETVNGYQDEDGCPDTSPSAAFSPMPGAYGGSLELVGIDDPYGSGLGCIPLGSRLPVTLTFPLPSNCTLDQTHASQDDYRFTCRTLGSGGHYTPEPNPYEDRTYRLSFSSAPVQVGGSACSCFYYTAIGTMLDQDNWRSCHARDWIVRAYILDRCPVTNPDGSCTP